MIEKKQIQISELGKFKLIDRLTKHIKTTNPATILGIGDDAAVIGQSDSGDKYTLLANSLMLEGIDFDLTYFPLKHLGYKAVVVACSNAWAMNGVPEQLSVSVGVSTRFGVEDLEELFDGIRLACTEYSVDIVGVDASSSLTGLTIGLSVVGNVSKNKITKRSGAQLNDLICITGDLGAAYMGLHLLEREKIALGGDLNSTPNFDGYEYILESYLKPRGRGDVVENLAAAGLTPTSMIDLSNGLASDLLQICKSSNCGARIYLERLPISKPTHKMAEELHSDPVVAALNGGQDYELMFTVPLTAQEVVFKVGGIDIIGHITAVETGVALTTPDGQEVAITAPGHI